MPELKACLVCFTMDVMLISMDNNQLRHQYNLLTGLQLQKGNGMPGYLCYQCCDYLTRFIMFRDKCHKAYFVLDQLLQKDNKIRKAALEAVINWDSNNIKPCLSYFNEDVNNHYKQHDFKEMKNNHCMNSIHVMTHSTLTKEQMYEVAKGSSIKQEDESVNDEKINMTEINMSIVFNSNNDEEMNAQNSSFNSDKTEVFHKNDKNSCLDSDDNANMSRRVKSEDQPLDMSREADGNVLETEYAIVHAISRNEAQAALAILKTIGLGKHVCNVCERRFKTEDRLKEHLPVHDRLTANGRYFCDLCIYYYKSSFLLKTHMTEKHMYKYVCKKCPEVCFERMTAKQHYSISHLRKNNDEPWELVRPSWLMTKGGRRKKGVTAAKLNLPKRKRSKLPADIVYTPVSQEEQFARIQDRKKSRSYIESPYKCHLCFKGCMDIDTYCKHMRKHDPAISGDLQCDMCKLYFKKNLQIYHHMKQTHMNKFSCRLCDYVCYHRGQAILHYKTHKNVTYKCPRCPLEFKHLMTRQTHLRRNHPSSFICNLCGHNFVSETGLNCHKQISHTAEEMEASSKAPVDKTNALYCADCDIFFFSDVAFKTHLGSSKNHGRSAGATPVIRCKISQCNKFFASKKQGIEHYSTEHPGNEYPKPYMCDVCGFSTRQYTNLVAHMRIHTNEKPFKCPQCDRHFTQVSSRDRHMVSQCNKFFASKKQGIEHYSTEHPGNEYPKPYMCDVCGFSTRQYTNLVAHMRIHTNEKPFKCPQCDRHFTQVSSRDRHMVVHTGEKRYQCHLCPRRFKQSNGVKLHIQTVHLKIPYAPWDKKNRKRRQELKKLQSQSPQSTSPTEVALPKKI